MRRFRFWILGVSLAGLIVLLIAWWTRGPLPVALPPLPPLPEQAGPSWSAEAFGPLEEHGTEEWLRVTSFTVAHSVHPVFADYRAFLETHGWHACTAQDPCVVGLESLCTPTTGMTFRYEQNPDFELGVFDGTYWLMPDFVKQSPHYDEPSDRDVWLVLAYKGITEFNASCGDE